MLKRHPHTAVITLDVKKTGEDTGLVTRSSVQTKYELDGRLEFTSENTKKYEAIFYTTASSDFTLFEKQNAVLTCLGREFKVKRIIPFQTHAEIWLN